MPGGFDVDPAMEKNLDKYLVDGWTLFSNPSCHDTHLCMGHPAWSDGRLRGSHSGVLVPDKGSVGRLVCDPPLASYILRKSL